jgi:hypothetical protein
MSGTDSATLTLRFYDLERPDEHFASAAAVAQSLDAIQRLVFLAAMRREGRTPGQRIRPSADLQNRYRLICGVPEAGSFISPIRLEGAGLLASADATEVLGEIEKLFELIGAADERNFIGFIPDETWRRLTIDALARVAPAPYTRANLQITKSGTVLIDTLRSRPFVERLSRATTTSSARGAVVGQFKRIDFAQRAITIRHNETERDLTCLYEAHVEESLLEHPRDLLLVFGTVTRDVDGRPLYIEDVDHIEVIDLDPIPVPHVFVGNILVVPTEPLEAQVFFDENDALYTASLPSLIDLIFGETREALASALEDEIAILWRRYACAPDEKLTRAALALKSRIIHAFRGIENAA